MPTTIKKTAAKTSEYISEAITWARMDELDLNITLKSGTDPKEAKALFLEIKSLVMETAIECKLDRLIYGRADLHQMGPDMLFMTLGKIDISYVQERNKITVYAHDLEGQKVNKKLIGKLLRV